MAEEVFDHIVAGAHIGSKLELLEVDQALCLDELQVLGSVQVLFVLSLCEVKFVVRSVVLIVVALQDVVVQGTVLVETDSSIIGPAVCDILDCIATASKHK